MESYDVVPCVGRGDGAEKHNKLVTAQTGREITSVSQSRHASSGGDQQLVSDKMSVSVVYLFEVVEVDEYDGEWAGGGSGLLEFLVELGTVRESGEWVPTGFVACPHE